MNGRRMAAAGKVTTDNMGDVPVFLQANFQVLYQDVLFGFLDE